ncbi:MAG TPA: hypothetical protein VKT83_03495 [bacterium]|nr:hypothetical protein [bacterium]
MTICIAALCDNNKTLIMVADRRVGLASGEMETDTEIKIHKISPTWFTLVAGNDVEAAHEIAATAGGALRDRAAQGSVNGTLDVRRELVESYRRVRMHHAAAEPLVARGWTLNEFKDKGHKSLPESTFAEIDGGLQRYDLEVDLIACGFFGDDDGDIITVHNPGVGKLVTSSHFAAAGTGSTAAIFSLFMRKFHSGMSLPLALYYVYEAKVAAQRATGVGETTVMLVMRKGQTDHVSIDESEQSDVLEIIRQDLAPRYPSDEQVEEIRQFESLKKLPSLPSKEAQVG